MKKIIKYTMSVLVLLSVLSCKKDKKILLNSNDEPEWLSQTITEDGGNILMKDGVKLVFPKGAVSESTEVTVGYSGDEPTSVPNPSLEVIGRPFTIQVAVDSFIKDVLIEIPKPSGYTKAEEIGVFISNGDNYFPLFWEESKDKLIARLDYVNFEKIYEQKIVENGRRAGILPKSRIVSVLKNKQTPPANEMGIKKVEVANGGLIFSNVPILKSSDKVLVLVHGWTSSPAGAWSKFLSKIQSQVLPSGYTHFLTFGYYSGDGIDVNGQKLATILKTLMNGAEVDIIGHSMGGLVSRSAIENHEASSYVRNLITIGTPHKGAELALLRGAMGNIVFATSLNWKNYDINSKGLKDLKILSSFLTKLNKNPLPSTNYYPIASVGKNGNGDGIVSKRSALGIQGNENFTTGKTFFIDKLESHTFQTENDEIIQHIAEKLNNYNIKAFLNPNLNYASVNDIDGNQYATIQIGTQTWMAQNLKTTKYNDGSAIPNITNNTSWSNLKSGAWANYNNDIHYSYLGKLYNWYAVNTGKLCPQGWHIPTDEEWTELTKYLGGESNAGIKMKSTGNSTDGTGLWEKSEDDSSKEGTNESGFSGLPGGYCYYDGAFDFVGYIGSWWSSTEYEAYYAWSRYLFCDNSKVGRDYFSGKEVGASCRCVKD